MFMVRVRDGDGFAAVVSNLPADIGVSAGRLDASSFAALIRHPC